MVRIGKQPVPCSENTGLCTGGCGMRGREQFSHGRGRWFNPSRAHQFFRDFLTEKTAPGCSEEHEGPRNAAGLSPPPRRSIALPLRRRDWVDAAWIAALALIVGLGLLWGPQGRCDIVHDEAMPWVQEQRSGCPEELP